MSIRSTVKAIILSDQKILLNQYQDPEVGCYFTLPGGGQEKYETIEEAVIRECLEETGYTVKPEAFLALYEEIYTHTMARDQYAKYAHKIIHFYKCSLTDQKKIAPTGCDEWQLDSIWVDFDDIPSINLYPVCIRENIHRLIITESPIYFGSHFVDLIKPV